MMYMGVDMTIKMATVGTNINDVSLTNLPCHEKTNLINYLIAQYFLNSYLRVITIYSNKNKKQFVLQICKFYVLNVMQNKK